MSEYFQNLEEAPSWQSYVDALLATRSVTAAGIYDRDGNPWAYSVGFAVQIAEAGRISQGFADLEMQRRLAEEHAEEQARQATLSLVSGTLDTANPLSVLRGQADVFAEIKAAARLQDKTRVLARLRLDDGAFCVSSDETDMYFMRCSTGYACAACKSCIVIGFHDASVQAGNCRREVELLGDYLRAYD